MPSWALQTLGVFRFSCDDRQLAIPSPQKGRALLTYSLTNPYTEAGPHIGWPPLRGGDTEGCGVANLLAQHVNKRTVDAGIRHPAGREK
jgi:hypothetical protein